MSLKPTFFGFGVKTTDAHKRGTRAISVPCGEPEPTLAAVLPARGVALDFDQKRASVTGVARIPVKTDRLALLVTKHVPRGHVTTYGDLSESVYGHNRGTKAISVMMKAWASQDPRNWTHRVVNDDGTLADVALHRERLLKERVEIDSEGRVLLEKHRVALPPFKPPT